MITNLLDSPIPADPLNQKQIQETEGYPPMTAVAVPNKRTYVAEWLVYQFTINTLGKSPFQI